MQLLTKDTIAPYSGTFNALNSHGEVVGTVILETGAVLPPTPFSFGYYSFNELQCSFVCEII